MLAGAKVAEVALANAGFWACDAQNLPSGYKLVCCNTLHVYICISHVCVQHMIGTGQLFAEQLSRPIVYIQSLTYIL